MNDGKQSDGHPSPEPGDHGQTGGNPFASLGEIDDLSVDDPSDLDAPYGTNPLSEVGWSLDDPLFTDGMSLRCDMPSATVNDPIDDTVHVQYPQPPSPGETTGMDGSTISFPSSASDIDETVFLIDRDLPGITRVADPDITYLSESIADPVAMRAPGAGSTAAWPAAAAAAAAYNVAPEPVVVQPAGTPRKHHKIAIAVITVLILLASMGAALYYTYSHEYWGGRTLPDVVGMSSEDATESLSSLGFTVRQSDQLSDDGIGQVLTMDPQPGERFQSGTIVSLGVGVARVIPDVVGLAYDEAASMLLEQGAEDIQVEYSASDSNEGDVLEVTPAAGTVFKSTDTVVLRVSKPYMVPDVVGMTEDEALAAIEEAGLTGHVSYVTSDEPKRTVISTSPAADTRMLGGATVEISVASPYPESVYQLPSYLTTDPGDVSEYLQDQDFTLAYGYRPQDGQTGVTSFYSNRYGLITLTDDPFVYAGSIPGISSVNPLAEGIGFSVVRYDISQSTSPVGRFQTTLQQLTELVDLCNLDSSTLVETGMRDTFPTQGADDKVDGKIDYISGYGRNGDYIWTIIIDNSFSTPRAVVTMGPASTYESILGGSGLDCTLADYVAYREIHG